MGGSSTSLWRIGSVQGYMGPVGNSGGATAKLTGLGGPVFRFKITCSNPPSNNFGVNVVLANGVSSMSEWVQTIVGAQNSASAMGAYPVGQLLTASVTGGYSDNVPLSGYRAIDAEEPATLINGVGYFGYSTPVNISGNYSAPTSGGGEGDVDAQSSWEFVPFHVLGP